jgi:outer membrane protein TolC
MKRLDLLEILPLRPLLLVALLTGLLLPAAGQAAAQDAADPAAETTLPAGRLLTLEESVALALEKNFGIRQQRRSHLSAEEDLKYARAERFYPRAWTEFLLPSYREDTIRQFDLDTGIERFASSDSTTYDGSVFVALPVFTGGYFQFSYDTFRLDQTSGENEVHTWSSTGRLSFIQPFLGDNDGKLAETRAATSLQISVEALRRQVAGLTYDVAAAYYGLVRAIKREGIGSDRLEQARSSYEMACNKFAAGLIPEVEAMQLEVELARAEADQESSKAAHRANLDQFRDILGLGLDEDVSVVTEVPLAGKAIDLQAAVQQALTGRSDIREQDLQIELARLDLRSVRRENNLQGNLSMFYGYDGKEESYSDTLDKWQPNQGLTLSVSLPLFDSGRNKSRVTRQRLSLESLELGLADLRRRVELEVRDAVRTVEEANTRLEILASTLRVAERTYEINLQRFEVGTLTSQELFQEEVRLNETRLEHLNAVIDLNLAWARYQRVVHQ